MPLVAGSSSWQDHRYRVTLTIPYFGTYLNGTPITIKFSSNLDSNKDNESWGIDNFDVTLISTALGLDDPITQRYEAEHIPLDGVNANHLRVTNLNYSGEQGVEFDSGVEIEWVINANNQGVHEFVFAYAFAPGASRPMELYIDDEKIDDIEFKSSGSNDVIAFEYYSVNLSLGRHTVSLKRVDIDGPIFDYLDVLNNTSAVTGRSPKYFFGGDSPSQFDQQFSVSPDSLVAKLYIGDRIVHPTDQAIYVEMKGDGNLALINNGTEVFSTHTSAFWLEGNLLRKSGHHAKCKAQGEDGDFPICKRGVAFHMDSKGISVISDTDLMVWRPDLGDTTIDDHASEGFYIRVAKLSSNRVAMQLVAKSNGHVIWDSIQGFRPYTKTVYGLFTAIEESESAQLKEVPYGSLTDGVQYASPYQNYYVQEVLKQQSALHSNHAITYEDDVISESRNFDKLITDPDSGNSVSELRAFGNGLNLSKLSFKVDNASPEIVIASSSHRYSSLHVTHKGLEYWGYNSASSTGQLVWSVYPESDDPNGVGVDASYMLSINPDLKRLELHNMATDNLVWYLSNNTSAQGLKVQEEQVVTHVLFKRMSRVWTHMYHFVEEVDDEIKETALYGDIKHLLQDAVHLHFHDALADLEQLETHVASNLKSDLIGVAKLMKNVAKVGLWIETQQFKGFLDAYQNTDHFIHQLFDVIKHPKKLGAYIHNVIDELKAAHNKLTILAHIAENPESIKSLIRDETGINDLDDFSQELAEDHSRSLLLNELFDDNYPLSTLQTENGWTSEQCNESCRFYSHFKKSFVERAFDFPLNFFSESVGENFSPHTIKGVQIRAGWRPYPRLVTIESTVDGGDPHVLRSGQQINVKFVDVTALISHKTVASPSFAAAGVLTSSDFLYYDNLSRSNTDPEPLDDLYTSYSSTYGVLGWADINVQTLLNGANALIRLGSPAAADTASAIFQAAENALSRSEPEPEAVLGGPDVVDMQKLAVGAKAKPLSLAELTVGATFSFNYRYDAMSGEVFLPMLAEAVGAVGSLILINLTPVGLEYTAVLSEELKKPTSAVNIELGAGKFLGDVAYFLIRKHRSHKENDQDEIQKFHAEHNIHIGLFASYATTVSPISFNSNKKNVIISGPGVEPFARKNFSATKLLRFRLHNQMGRGARVSGVDSINPQY